MKVREQRYAQLRMIAGASMLLGWVDGTLCTPPSSRSLRTSLAASDITTLTLSLLGHYFPSPGVSNVLVCCATRKLGALLSPYPTLPLANTAATDATTTTATTQQEFSPQFPRTSVVVAGHFGVQIRVGTFVPAVECKTILFPLSTEGSMRRIPLRFGLWNILDYAPSL